MTYKMSTRVRVDSLALYIAINVRDGYTDVGDELPRIEVAQTKIPYLADENERGLLYAGRFLLIDTTFLAAYSGEVLSTRSLLTHKEPRVHSYTIALANEDNVDDVLDEKPVRYYSRQWLLSGWNSLGKEAKAIFANHQIVENHRKWTLNEVAPTNEAYSGTVVPATLAKLNEHLGTKDLVFFYHDTPYTSVYDIPRTATYDALRIEINYPANAELTRMTLDRTYILSNAPKRGEVAILGGGASHNRLVHWRGTICCRVTYIESLPDVTIRPGEEILIKYGREYQEYDDDDGRAIYSIERTRAYYPSIGRPYLRVFPLTATMERSENRFVQRLEVDSRRLPVVLCDLVPLVLLRANLDHEASPIVAYHLQQFSTKYATKPLLHHENKSVLLQMLIYETLGLLLPDTLRPAWLRDEPNDDGRDWLTVRFMMLLHELASFMQADDLDRLSRKLYKSSFIHLVVSRDKRDTLNRLLYLLRDERMRRSKALCFAEPLEKEYSGEALANVLIENAKILRTHYEIPLLGETNILYRDSLYYMTRDDKDDTVLGESLYAYNGELRIYEASRGAFITLVAPVVSKLPERDTLIDEALAVEGTYGTTLKSLKVTFIYYLEQWATQWRVADFHCLTQIYMRLFATMRLLPLTQLEDAWLVRLYDHIYALYRWALQNNASRDHSASQQMTPLLLTSFDYRATKHRWYKKLLTDI